MTLFACAERFVHDIRELPGPAHDPFIQWCFTRCGYAADTPDETPWCSAFLNGVCWLLRLPRSKSAAARSWLAVGAAVELHTARVGWDIVVLTRGSSPTAGHVGVFAGFDPVADTVELLGGNQSDTVTVARFPARSVLGVRRLSPPVLPPTRS